MALCIANALCLFIQGTDAGFDANLPNIGFGGFNRQSIL
jgi:hypothetical protein